MYPLPSLNMPLVMADTAKKGATETVATGNKRRGESTGEGSEDTKRARVTTATGGPQSAGSSPSPQPPLLRPTPHRSPVIKYNLLPYNIGGAAVVAPGQQTTPTSLTQTVILSITPGAASAKVSPHSSSSHLPTSTPSSTSTPPHSSLITPSLPHNLLITALRCFGLLQIPASVPASQLVTSDLLCDLYRSSYHTTSELSGSLSPESCALLTIAYLSSLRRGERICVESLHTMLKYARTGESEWLQYYKRHKKMSESTFVQSQLMHLSRISVYPALGRVRVMISNEHLGQGITLTLKNLAQLVAMTTEALPDFVVVLAVRANVGVEFCILVLEPLLSQLLLRQQKSRSRRLAQGVLKNAKVAVGDGGSSSDPCSSAEVKIEKKQLIALRKLQRRLKGAVHIPFREPGNEIMMVPESKAEVMTPSAPHVIEHKPRGPFPAQYQVAMHLMQRLNGSGSGVKLDSFLSLDFCVLCPAEEVSFVSQVKRELVESGLGELVREGGCDGVLEERIIRCCEEDYSKFSKFLNEVHTHQETLYLVAVEHADITSSLSGGVATSIVANSNGNNRTSCYGEHKILLGQPNVVMLYVTSQPYRLITNRFLVSAANEIHWPLQTSVSGQSRERGEQREEETEFCCVAGLPGATVKGAGLGGVVVCEDERMEEKFHSISTQLCPSADFAVIRHQLLLNDYVAALAGHAHPTNSAHPDTQSIVRCLIEEPLATSRGRGSMLLIRSHDSHMGQQFFSQLRAARNALGLQCRFEIILDTGREGLNLSPHFLRRVRKVGINKESGCYGNDCDGGRGNGYQEGVITYSDLENVPCVVVMTGEERPHLSLPSSLRWVDLRLLYPTDITRSVYERELAWANGYLPHTVTPSLLTSSHLTQTQSLIEKDASSHHSDEHEMMSSESHDPTRPHPPATPLSSSSSRRSSVTDTAAMATEGEGGGVRERGSGVVEWRAGTTEPSSTLESCDSEEEEEGRDEEEDEVIDVSDLPVQPSPTVTMTTTVLIDPPDDQLDPPSSSHHLHHQTDGETWPYPHSTVFPNHQNRTETDPSTSLFAELSDSESDSEDERELSAVTRTCLLPRPFYHIWTSRNMQQALLLPPATGVEWASPSSKHSRSHGNATSNGPGSTHSEKARRPPLFDPDPAHQTSYYRKWTKPSNSVSKKALDMLLRATISGTKRRFLLTGPCQVGKSGAWHLLVRLLHDHLRTCHSVIVDNSPVQPPLILQESALHHSSAGGTRSRVVAAGYLKQLYDELLENDKKPFPSSPPSPSNQTTPTQATPTTVLTLSPYATHDRSHTCSSCTELTTSSSSSTPSLLSQSVPTSHDNHITICWSVPASMKRHCVTDRETEVFERLCLPLVPDQPDENLFDKVPIFIPSLGRSGTALLNLSHTGFSGIHVIVTTTSKMTLYMRAWPGHLIMALPDNEALGRGMLYSRLKLFLEHNYQRNCLAASESARPLPWALVMADSCVMWRSRGERSCDLSLSHVLQTLSQRVRDSDCTAASVPQWSSTLTPSPPHSSHTLTHQNLNHNFLLLNIAMTTKVNYRMHSYTSFDADFDLQLFVGGAKTVVCTDMFVVKKHFPPSNTLALHSDVTTVATDVDNIAVSLHDSSAPLVDYPGPYLLEHYLRMKSSVLFPSAHSPIHPVLMIDHYINLGPQTHTFFLPSSHLHDDNSSHTPSGVKYGGLLLYLCEGRVSRQQLRQLGFVGGACVCLVTESSGSLVREAGRLDLEERWKFRLRDEYKTACPDSAHWKPLYFLIGRFGM